MSMDRTSTSAETEAEERETVARGTADRTPAVAIGAAGMARAQPCTCWKTSSSVAPVFATSRAGLRRAGARCGCRCGAASVEVELVACFSPSRQVNLRAQRVDLVVEDATVVGNLQLLPFELVEEGRILLVERRAEIDTIDPPVQICSSPADLYLDAVEPHQLVRDRSRIDGLLKRLVPRHTSVIGIANSRLQRFRRSCLTGQSGSDSPLQRAAAHGARSRRGRPGLQPRGDRPRRDPPRSDSARTPWTPHFQGVRSRGGFPLKSPAGAS